MGIGVTALQMPAGHFMLKLGRFSWGRILSGVVSSLSHFDHLWPQWFFVLRIFRVQMFLKDSKDRCCHRQNITINGRCKVAMVEWRIYARQDSSFCSSRFQVLGISASSAPFFNIPFL
jgi:hypothetical protein